MASGLLCRVWHAHAGLWRLPGRRASHSGMSNDTDSPSGIEAGFAALEQRLADADRRAAGLHAAIRKGLRAAREGSAGALPDSLAQSRRLSAEIATVLDEAAALPVPDIAAAFRDGGFVAELKAQAQEHGVRLVEREGKISAFPVIVRLEPRAQAVRFGRKLERRVRPSFLAGLLRAVQLRPDRFQARAFLDRLFAAYRPLAAAVEPAWRPETGPAGPLVPLLDLHALLTVLPVAAADYPVEEFAADLLRLDRTPDATTGTGHRFALSAATGTKGRKRVTVFDEQGGQHEYFAIRFSPEPSHAASDRPGPAAR